MDRTPHRHPLRHVFIQKTLYEPPPAPSARAYEWRPGLSPRKFLRMVFQLHETLRVAASDCLHGDHLQSAFIHLSPGKRRLLLADPGVIEHPSAFFLWNLSTAQGGTCQRASLTQLHEQPLTGLRDVLLFWLSLRTSRFTGDAVVAAVEEKETKRLRHCQKFFIRTF